MFDEIYEAEELILSMAYIVKEKRRLELENEELKEQVKWYKNDLNDRYRASQENVGTILKTALQGCVITE